MADTKTPAAKTLYTCGKCDGRGKIQAFSHYANGDCFDCGGTGKLEGDAMSETETARHHAHLAMYSLTVAMEATDRGDTDRATHYARGALDDLFACGTVLARQVLDQVGAGRYWDDETQGWHELDHDDAQTLRAEIIALGFAHK